MPEMKKRGRGSELFKERYGDFFCVLKRRHAVEVLRYVVLSNKERGGMVTVVATFIFVFTFLSLIFVQLQHRSSADSLKIVIWNSVSPTESVRRASTQRQSAMLPTSPTARHVRLDFSRIWRQAKTLILTLASRTPNALPASTPRQPVLRAPSPSAKCVRKDSSKP